MKIIFLGPPGAGKGTAASRIAPKLGIPHISTGDLFRKNIKEGTSIGIKAKKYMDEGKLVPDEVVMWMVEERIKKDDCKGGFILDGVPRTINQAEILENITDIDHVINLSITDKMVIRRNSARLSCPPNGYNCSRQFQPIFRRLVCVPGQRFKFELLRF